jgi:hypothetical protein
MTKLKPGKKLVRETAVLERIDPVVVELEPRTATLRIKGHPSEKYSVNYDVLLAWLRKRDWQQKQRERNDVRG